MPHPCGWLPSLSPSTSSLLLIDIDYFKNYNDSLGHVEGDQALRQVAANIHQALVQEAIGHPGSPISRYLTASIGIGTVWVEARTTSAELVRFADEQLYGAKA